MISLMKRPADGERRGGGWMLVELMIAIAVLAIGILGFLFSFQANFRTTRELGMYDEAQVAMESVLDTLRADDFPTLYARYQNSTFPVNALTDPAGGPARVQVTFFVNETALPAEFGSVLDMDGDGKRATANASANYLLLPTRLSISYTMSYGVETKTVDCVLGPTR